MRRPCGEACHRAGVRQGPGRPCRLSSCAPTLPDACDCCSTFSKAPGWPAPAGIRPFLPALVAGALATADVGIDYEGTPFAFLEQPGWLLAVVLALIAVVVAAAPRRARAACWTRRSPGSASGSARCCSPAALADHGYAWWPGLLGGAPRAALAGAATQSLVVRTRARLDAEARAALPVYLEGHGRRARRAGRRRRARSRPSRSASSPSCCAAGAAARARSTRACASCGEPRPPKLVLTVIDGMKPTMLERAIGAGSARRR